MDKKLWTFQQFIQGKQIRYVQIPDFIDMRAEGYWRTANKNREHEESKNRTTSEEGRQKVTFIKRRVSGIADLWRGQCQNPKRKFALTLHISEIIKQHQL